MNIGVWISAIFTLVVLSGCATQADTTPKLGLLGVTDEQFDKQFFSERKHLERKRPKLGLSLAGGGTKSATFSHGVLHGLQESGALESVDAISTVSGGGYAAFWYFSHALEMDRQGLNREAIFADCFPLWWNDKRAEAKLKEVFEMGRTEALKHGKAVCRDSRHQVAGDPFRWQAQIPRWPDVFETEITTVTGNTQSRPTGNIARLVGTALMEVFTFWDGRESLVAIGYQEGIERAWGLNPLERKNVAENIPESGRWEYSNSAQSTHGHSIRVNPQSVQWTDLQTLYAKDQKLPLWILNTNSGQKGKLPDLSNLYEITPFGYGSPNPLFPYSSGQHPEPLRSMATSTRASAAFLDPQGLASPVPKLLNGATALFRGFRWGVKIAPDGTRLSDGGGVDNLGLVSLVRRGIEDIIVVDSAQDDQGTFGDLCWAQRALGQEGLILTMHEALENFDRVCAQHFDGKNIQKLGYNVSAWKNPVVPGVITWSGSERKTRIWVIKAGWDQGEIAKAYNASKCGYESNQVPCELLLFFGHNTTVGSDYMIFPQHETASDTVNSSSYQIFGYREIGKMLAKKLKVDPVSHQVSLVEDNLRKQTLYCIRKKDGRPGPGPYDAPEAEGDCPEAH